MTDILITCVNVSILRYIDMERQLVYQSWFKAIDGFSSKKLGFDNK